MMLEMAYAYVLGLLSILSPCTLIIVPMMTSDLNAKLGRVLKFLAGIIVTFVVLGILSALTGKLLTNFFGPYLYLFAGAITLLAGLDRLNIIVLRLPSLFAGIRTRNTFLMGLVYGGVALSCVGPLLASVLAYITAKASVFYGFSMMFLFSLGFITPFVLFGFLIADQEISKKLIRHSLLVRKMGGLLLLLVSAYLWFIALRGVL